jgi:hypothetical protein
MILSDMRKDNETNSKSYKFTAWMLGIMLLMWIGFTFVGFFTTIGPTIDMLEGRMTGTMPQQMMMPQQPMMMPQQPMMTGFGRRLNHPLLL